MLTINMIKLGEWVNIALRRILHIEAISRQKPEAGSICPTIISIDFKGSL